MTIYYDYFSEMQGYYGSGMLAPFGVLVLLVGIGRFEGASFSDER